MANLFSEKPILKVVMLKGQDGEEKLINQADGSGLSFWIGTQAEYDAIPEAELTENCVYYITDATTDNFNTRLNQLDTAVDNNTTAIASNTEDIAELMATPNKVLFDGDPILAGNTFEVPKGLMQKYKLFAISIADVDTIAGSADVQTLLFYRDGIIDAPFILDFKLAEIVESTDTADTVKSISYAVTINEVVGTDTDDKFSLTHSFKAERNLTTLATSSTNYYLHKIVGVI